MQISLTRIFLALLILLLGGLPGGAGHAAVKEPHVVSVVVSQTKIVPGGELVMQATVRNTTNITIPLGLRVDLRDQGDQRVGTSQTKREVLLPGDEKRVFFRFFAPGDMGRYSVRLVVMTKDFKRNMLTGEPVFHAPFEVGDGPPTIAAMMGPGQGGAGGRAPNYTPPAGLRFERPDLVWENFRINPPALVLGEPLHIRADLRNVGGDVARKLEVSLDYFNTGQPNRITALSTSNVTMLAPGEKIELEFEAVLPSDTTLGEYKVMLTADAKDEVHEAEEANNRVVSGSSFSVSHVKLIFPEPDYTFEESGLFLFRWDSLRYNEFKVQVGTDPRFSEPETFFDIPQGQKWTRQKEVVPLEGELPAMGRGLMEKAKASVLYWRIRAKNSETGQTWNTETRKFTIMPSKKPVEEVPEEETSTPQAAPQTSPQTAPPKAPKGTPTAPPTGGQSNPTGPETPAPQPVGQ